MASFFNANLPNLGATTATQSGRRTNLSRERHCNGRSEEHTSELQSLMRISYAVFCLKKKKIKIKIPKLYTYRKPHKHKDTQKQYYYHTNSDTKQHQCT